MLSRRVFGGVGIRDAREELGVLHVKSLERGDRVVSKAGIDERVDERKDAVDLRERQGLVGHGTEVVQELTAFAREACREVVAGGGVADEAQDVVAEESVVVLQD